MTTTIAGAAAPAPEPGGLTVVVVRWVQVALATSALVTVVVPLAGVAVSGGAISTAAPVRAAVAGLLAVLLVFSSYRAAPLLAGAALVLAALVVLSLPSQVGVEVIYSPYLVLERGAGARGEMLITASGTCFQRVHDLSLDNASRDRDAALRAAAAYYELPYRLGLAPRRVLVVGAGTGNDVAAALRMGAERVDAVEIDPGIAALGRACHPEQPYSDPRLRLVVDDARSFLRSSRETYDLVVYGLLDSHTLLSQASSVRLDSFVYTVEGLRDGRARLAPGGVMCLSFYFMSPEMGRKVQLMVEEAFDGAPAVCVGSTYDRAVVHLGREGGVLEVPRELYLAGGVAIAAGDMLPPGLGRRLLAVIVLTCPLFFSGVAFSSLLRAGGASRPSWPPTCSARCAAACWSTTPCTSAFTCCTSW